jgi:hypothetical protein
MGELFMLRTDDVIIKGWQFVGLTNASLEYSCSVKKKIKLHGILYIFGKHIGFYSKVFGNVTKVLETFGDVEDIQVEGRKGNKLILLTNKKQKVSFVAKVILTMKAYILL